MMMGKGVFLSLFGWVLLIGGVVWGFGCGFGWGVRGVLRIVFLIPANPFPGPVSGSIKHFFAI